MHSQNIQLQILYVFLASFIIADINTSELT